ncbi:MAG: histidine phosphatase family protein [Bdellovibrionales bacterium]|nr:histidine phosphatase family protein [Bdellovibrionales bacterium]
MAVSKVDRELFVFRHGQTDWNLQGRLQGHTDVPLNEIGMQQAQQLSTQLTDLCLEVVLSSDLERAHVTAQIATLSRIPILTTKNLREARLGIAEGKSKNDPLIIDGYRRWLDPEDDEFFFAGGESPSEHKGRIIKYLDSVFAEEAWRRIGISTHGGTMVRFVEICKNRPKEKLFFDNGAIIKISVTDSGWIYEGLVKSDRR